MEQSYPKITAAKDRNDLLFEVYELRKDGRSLFIDVKIAELCGGIEKVRNGIVPYHMIVMELLK